MENKIIDLRNRTLKDNIIFDEKTHIYTYNGKVLKSITRLLGELGISPSYQAVNMSTLIKSQNRGNAIHKEIEDYIKFGKNTESKVLMQFIRWLEDNDLTVIDSEYIVYSINDLLAGKVDLLLKDKNGNIIIADIKTTGVIHNESVSWQLSLYDYLGQENAVEGLCIHFDKHDNMTIKEIALKPQDAVFGLAFAKRQPVIKLDNATITKVHQALVSIDNLKQQIQDYQKTIDEFNEILIHKMEENGVKKFENDDLSITYVAPFERETIDSKKLKADLPDIAKKYTKVSTIKASVKITLKNKESE